MTQDPKAAAVLRYWTELGPEGWYAGGDALDSEIRARFLPLWTEARAKGLDAWRTSAEGMLASLLLTDQFPRNMFRGQAEAFATDPLARRMAQAAWQSGLDLKIEGPLRQFFYLPFMHSELGVDQDRSVALFAARMPASGADNLLHARAHRAVIRRFGRFPFRNEALGRDTTAEEQAWLDAGAYGAEVRALQGA